MRDENRVHQRPQVFCFAVGESLNVPGTVSFIENAFRVHRPLVGPTHFVLEIVPANVGAEKQADQDSIPSVVIYSNFHVALCSVATQRNCERTHGWIKKTNKRTNSSKNGVARRLKRVAAYEQRDLAWHTNELTCVSTEAVPCDITRVIVVGRVVYVRLIYCLNVLLLEWPEAPVGFRISSCARRSICRDMDPNVCENA